MIVVVDVHVDVDGHRGRGRGDVVGFSVSCAAKSATVESALERRSSLASVDEPAVLFQDLPEAIVR